MRIKLFGEIRAIPGEIVIAEEFRDADVTVFNLETPITQQMEPITKTGVCLKGSREDFLRFTAMFSEKKRHLVITLANNHIGDYGSQGIQDTVDTCREAGVHYGGVSGGNRQEPVVVETAEGSLAIFCVGERQFGVSRNGVLGMDYLSPQLYLAIRKAKDAGYFVILSIHAAAEMNLWAAPLWQETLRSFVDAGVDVVHGHHSHVPQGWEEYGSGIIFYGLGHFLCSVQEWERKQNTLWGLCAEVEMRNGMRHDFRVIPLWLRETEDGKTLVEPVPENDVNHGMGERSGKPASEVYPTYDVTQAYLRNACRPLADTRLLEGLWQEFSMLMFEKWFMPFIGLNGVWVLDTGRLSRIQNAFHTLTAHYEKFIQGYRPAVSVKEYTVWYHWFSCETHRLAAETAFGLLCGEIKDIRTAETRTLLDTYFQFF